MPRKRTFRPPKVSSPPNLVEVQWVDAVHSNGDMAIESIGGLKQLPAGGYHVRTAIKGPDGPFVVIAIEHDIDDGGVPCARFHLSIPTTWIVGWKQVKELETLWPESKESATSTSSTRRRQKKIDRSETTISTSETSAGASLSASLPVEQLS